jgi:DNA-binding LytR/AlgR family response regulator
MNLIHCVVAEDRPAERKKLLESIDKMDFLIVSGTVKNAEELSQIMEFTETEVLFVNMAMPGIQLQSLAGKHHLPLLVNTNQENMEEAGTSSVKIFGSLQKGFSEEDVQSVALQIRDVLSMLIPSPKKQDCFYVRSEGRYEKLLMSDIAYISGMQNYIKIHFLNTKPMIVHSPMKAIFRQLNPSRFVMVHKSYIVNLDHISEVSGNFLSVPGHERIPIGRHFKAGVIPRLFAA